MESLRRLHDASPAVLHGLTFDSVLRASDAHRLRLPQRIRQLTTLPNDIRVPIHGRRNGIPHLTQREARP